MRKSPSPHRRQPSRHCRTSPLWLTGLVRTNLSAESTALPALASPSLLSAQELPALLAVAAGHGRAALWRS